MAEDQQVVQPSVEPLGLEVAWLEDEIETIAGLVAYLEQRNFIIHVSDDVDEVQYWVVRNGYDIILADLYLPDSDSSGIDLIKELTGAKKTVPMMPVSHYLHDKVARGLPRRFRDVAIDKGRLASEADYEWARNHILDVAGGGRTKVVERAFGFIDEEVDDLIIVRLRMPSGKRSSRVFRKKDLERLGVGHPKKHLEITTVERVRGGGTVVETLLRWVPDLPLVQAEERETSQ